MTAALPLAGLRIVDLTTIVVGPVCTQRLAEYGAEVIKIEPPEGDLLRAIGGASKSGGMAPPYLQMNRGKRSVAIDLKSKGGRVALDAILDGADAFISNMRPEALARLGIGPADMIGRFPSLVHCTITGYGTDGPYASQPAYDSVVQGATGVGDLFRLRGGAPAYAPFLMADHITGEIAAGALLAALLARADSGQGAVLEVPMFEVMSAFVMQEHMGGLSFPDRHDPPGDRRVLSPANRPAKTRDGWISVTTNTDRQSNAMLRALGRADVVGDPRFADARSRVAHIDAWLALRNAELAKKTTREWVETLRDADVPCMPCQTLEELAQDPHLDAVEFFQTGAHPTEGRARTMRGAVRFNNRRAAHLAPTQPLGWSTRDVLGECGFSKQKIEELLGEGSVIDGCNSTLHPHSWGVADTRNAVIGEINDQLGPEDAIRHVDRKYLNNRIESDHAALKQRLRPMRGFQTLAGAKAALAGIETFRTIRKGQFENCESGVANEIAFVAELFPKAA